MPELSNATPYDELNRVLAFLVNGAQRELAENFVGAYLQGSFAIGDYSEFSDCDFIIVTSVDLTGDQLSALQSLHKDIQRLPYSYWPINIEGSYTPAGILRRWSTEPRDAPFETRDSSWGDPGMDGTPARCYPFWYLNHGADTLVRSEHDNSQVVRWTLLEKGVRLTGPDIKDMIDPVSADDLRAEVRNTMDMAIGTGLEMPMFAYQASWVGLFCRILHTIETGLVTSKKASMDWALEALDSRWHSLIKRARFLRKGDDTQASSLPDIQDVVATRKFAEHCRELADVMLANGN